MSGYVVIHLLYASKKKTMLTQEIYLKRRHRCVRNEKKIDPEIILINIAPSQIWIEIERI